MKYCSTCDRPIGNFRNAASKKEAAISGMCQRCQDAYFGPEPKQASDQKLALSYEPKEDEIGWHFEEEDDRPRCGTCGHLTGQWGQCLDDQGHSVDCDCEDDGTGRRLSSNLPGWIKDSLT